MNRVLEKHRQFCLTAPRWMQLQLQAFWYGLLSTAITYVEEHRSLSEITATPNELCTFVDSEFETWAADWLMPYLEDFLRLKHTEEELYDSLERFDELFRDCVPGDLQIFTTLTAGSELTSEQWTRLYEAVAFTTQIDPKQVKSKNKQKTRCTHGRRAITPMRSRRALTRKSRHTTNNQNPVLVFKMNK